MQTSGRNGRDNERLNDVNILLIKSDKFYVKIIIKKDVLIRNDKIFKQPVQLPWISM